MILIVKDKVVQIEKNNSKSNLNVVPLIETNINY